MSSEDKSRLARWADRKTAARRRRGGAAPRVAEEQAAVPAPPRQDAKAEAEDTAPAPSLPELPDIDSLTADSDFSAFMKAGVPAELRRLALRKLWASDPAFNIIDEMVEYGEDYTNAATVVAGMKSAWEAGRGYARKFADTEAGEAAATDEVPAPESAAETGDGNDQDVASEAGDAADDESEHG